MRAEPLNLSKENSCLCQCHLTNKDDYPRKCCGCDEAKWIYCPKCGTVQINLFGLSKEELNGKCMNSKCNYQIYDYQPSSPMVQKIQALEKLVTKLSEKIDDLYNKDNEIHGDCKSCYGSGLTHIVHISLCNMRRKPCISCKGSGYKQ